MGGRVLAGVAARATSEPKAKRPMRRLLGTPEPLEGRTLTTASRDSVGSSAEVAPATIPVPADRISGGVRVSRDVPYTTRGGQSIALDLYRPTGTPPAGGWPAVVAFAGGGWRWADKAQYGQAVGSLAKYGFVVAVADYTYSSGAPGSRAWPADFEDARNAVRWVRRDAARLHVNPDKIAAEGSSSGAHLANLLGTYPDGSVSSDSLAADALGPGTTESVSARVQAVVDFYGPVDLADLYRDAPRVRPFLGTFLGGSVDEVPQRYAAASPSSYVSPDDPPFFIVQGTADPTVPPSQSQLLAHDLTQAGVPNQLKYLYGLRHGFEFHINKRLNLRPLVATFLKQALDHQPIATSVS
jgi:acetyl esterase/lipase